jgi:branched-chain amino acid transport system ATP-binding protein
MTTSGQISMDGVPVIEVEDLSVHFGGVTALDRVTLQVAEGKITGLIGPNGAGKSTLFSVISGLLPPSAGRVRFQGQPVPRKALSNLARQGLARSFQRPELFPELTVRDHFLLARRVLRSKNQFPLLFDRLKRPTSDDAAVVDRLIETLQLQRVADSAAGSLALATSRLVEIGRALAADPKVLLLDEPMSGLDSMEVEEVAVVLLDAVHTRGITLLIVEHDVGLVLKICDWIYVLDFGRLLAQGTPAEIAANQAVKDAYLGVVEQKTGS